MNNQDEIKDNTQMKVYIAYGFSSVLIFFMVVWLVWEGFFKVTHEDDLDNSVIYNSIVIAQETSNIFIMVWSGVSLFRQLNDISDTRNAFKAEKRTVMLTMIFFCVSFLMRIIMAILELANFYLSTKMGEVALVNFELCTTVINDQLPFYFFMCQHIRNIGGEEEEANSESG